METINIKNPALIKAFAAMKAENNNDTKTKFFQELTKSRFLTSATFDKEPVMQPDGKAKLPADAKINFRLITNSEGQKYFPVFTDMEELNKLPDHEKTKTITTGFSDYVRFLQSDTLGIMGVVINPFHENIIIPKEVILQLANARLTPTVKEMRIDKPTNIQLGQPNKYPTKMVDAVKTCLASKHNVNAAFLQLMKMDDDFSFLLIFDFNGEEDKTLYPEIAAIAVPHLNGIHLQMIARNSELGKKATNNIAPFYISRHRN